MRRSVISFLVVAIIALHQAEQAEAGQWAPATELTQLLNHAELVLQYLRQALQIGRASCRERV